MGKPAVRRQITTMKAMYLEHKDVLSPEFVGYLESIGPKYEDIKTFEEKVHQENMHMCDNIMENFRSLVQCCKQKAAI